jgi:hypothetical protein
LGSNAASPPRCEAGLSPAGGKVINRKVINRKVIHRKVIHRKVIHRKVINVLAQSSNVTFLQS